MRFRPATKKRALVAVDTSLGVEFVTVEYSGRGVVVTERVMEVAAKHLRIPVDEVYELISFKPL